MANPRTRIKRPPVVRRPRRAALSQAAARLLLRFAAAPPAPPRPPAPACCAEGGAAPRLARVEGVEIFSAGQHQEEGPWFGPADLDNMVNVFDERCSPALARPLWRPPVVLGHSPSAAQQLLEDSGIPAAGVVTRLWRDGDRLLADFADVPAVVADLINSRAYRQVSIECEKDKVVNGETIPGWCLDRVAVLGASLPQVKGLADLPAAQFTQRHGRVRVCFASAPRPTLRDRARGLLARLRRKPAPDAGLVFAPHLGTCTPRGGGPAVPIGAAASARGGEAGRVLAHAMRARHSLRKMGSDPMKLVNAFCQARRRQPGLLASEYLGTADRWLA